VLLRRLSPARQLRKLRRMYSEFEQLAEVLPRHLVQILEQVQAGKFDVHLEHRGLSPSVNRLVLGMLASALFLGSSWMLANKVPPLLLPQKAWLGIHEISVLGLAGCVISILIGLRLVRAIGKSGHLDNRDAKK
jgi:ubiquinone biosynthesis protein